MAHFKAWRVLADEPEYKPLNFKVPPFGSRVVEFGAGLGQDTRNLAKAGYRVLGVEVSDLAASEAKALSKKTLTEEQYKNFEYVRGHISIK
jgi:2-polyprenyl-3-methyl-5-hydroxy-6-metoxy-1,4-benzoquinol methylase